MCKVCQGINYRKSCILMDYIDEEWYKIFQCTSAVSIKPVTVLQGNFHLQQTVLWFFLKLFIPVFSRLSGQFPAEAFWPQHLTETSSCNRQCEICLWSCSSVILACARSLSGFCCFCLRNHWRPLISEESEQGKLWEVKSLKCLFHLNFPFCWSYFLVS